MATIHKIFPCLWFDTRAEEAANYYVNIFKNSSIGDKSYYLDAGTEIHGKPVGSLLTIEFVLEGQQFMAMNGGPEFKFNEAVSLMVNCNTQEEIDYYWDKLTPGGDPNAQQCGWLKDKFGLSWQINATQLDDMIKDKDTEKATRAMAAMMNMKKLDIKELQRAFNGDA